MPLFVCSIVCVMPIVSNFFSRVGKSIAGASNVANAIALAGLDFEVQLEPVFDSRGKQIADSFNVARKDNGESLGVNGARYTPIQTAQAFAYLDELAGHTQLTFHRGGMLKGGRFFVSVEFEQLNFSGDMVSAFGVFLSSFDGTWANRMVSVFNRHACMNICGYMLANKGDNNGLAAKHTENCEVKLDALASLIVSRQSRMEKQISNWQGAKFSTIEMEQLGNQLFPKETPQSVNARARLLSLFSDETLGQFGQTKWDAFNAVTALETHEGKRRNTIRANADENAFDALVSQRSLANRAAQLLG